MPDESAGEVHGGEVARFLSAWFAVRQLIQAANFNHFQNAGLSATQFMVLNILPENEEGISMGELARRMNLKPATVAKTVDSLQTREMLARTKSEADGRRVLVRITEQGRRLQNSSRGQFREYVEGLFRAMAQGDRADLIRGLESLVRASGGSVRDEEDAEVPGERSSGRSRRP